MAAPSAEVKIDVALVGALLEEQHPDMAGLPLVAVGSGWDNDVFRMGDDLAVRLPRRTASAHLIRHEQRWLPELAVGLPLPVPVPVRVGGPSDVLGYPWSWSVVPWFPGAPAEIEPPDDWAAAAALLGQFLAALHRVAPPDAPLNPYRGVPLTARTERLLMGLDQLGDTVDAPLVMEHWSALVDTPSWYGPPLWLHGDLQPLNIVVHSGRLAAVIDFGDMTAGDPASDLAVAWMLLPPGARSVLRRNAGSDEPVDDDTWARARGWALALGVAMANGDGRVAAIGHRTLAAVLADET